MRDPKLEELFGGLHEYVLDGVDEAAKFNYGMTFLLGCSVSESYLNAEYHCALRIAGPNGERAWYAFFKRDTLTPSYPAVSEVSSIEKRNDSYEVPVLVYIVKSRNPVEITAVPSLVWFDAPQEVGPAGVDVLYYSLRYRSFERFAGSSDGEMNISQATLGEPRLKRESVRYMIERGSKIMDRVPRRTYDLRRNRLNKRVRSLSAARIFLFANGVWIGFDEVVGKGQELVDVLVGPI